jgi:lysophospholipase L1-like esterase
MRLVRIAFAVAVAATAVTACSGTVTSSAAHRAGAPASYYLALGDSLSRGVQPDAAGISVETPHGYPDQVYALLRPRYPSLRLVKLGCPGETTGTMINGGLCRYPGGSQLAAAVAFLRAHRGHVLLVTLDIGANDPENCSKSAILPALSCLRTDIPGAASRLSTIVERLRAAAGPGVRIVGMSYYLPALAEWLDGTSGQAIAWLSERLAVGYNGLLDRTYTTSGARVADVFGAFHTGDFAPRVTVPGLGTVPRNVALICQWTWQCAAPPRGPNQHANQAGYGVIAGAFLRAAGLQLPLHGALSAANSSPGSGSASAIADRAGQGREKNSVRPSSVTIGVHQTHGLRHETWDRNVSTTTVTVVGMRRHQSRDAATSATASGGQT